MNQKSKPGAQLSIDKKYMLYIKEAASYFNIGEKKLRRLAEDNEGEFALFLGNRYLICRPKFEEYLQELMKNPSKMQGFFGDEEE